MGAFATLKLPVDLTQCHDAARVALTVVDLYPGTRNTTLDPATSTVTFELHFPGNLTGLVRRLQSNTIPVGETAEVSMPIERLVPDRADAPDAVAHRVLEGGEVWDVAFARGKYVHAAHLVGDRLEATIVPHTNALHQIYDSLLSLALVVNDSTLEFAGGV